MERSISSLLADDPITYDGSNDTFVDWAGCDGLYIDIFGWMLFKKQLIEERMRKQKLFWKNIRNGNFVNWDDL